MCNCGNGLARGEAVALGLGLGIAEKGREEGREKSGIFLVGNSVTEARLVSYIVLQGAAQ